jgi:hypothetical protein
MWALDDRKAILRLSDPLIHLCFEMCQAAEQFSLHHQLDFRARVGYSSFDVAKAPLDFVEPAVVTAQEINDLKQHRSMLIRVGPDLPKDRQH